MRRIPSQGTTGLALLVLFMTAPNAWAQGHDATGSSGAPVQRWTICVVEGESIRTDRGNRGTVYVSGVVPTVSPQNVEDVKKAFGQFITNKFLPAGLHSSPDCWSMPSAAEVLSVIKRPGMTPAPGQGIDLDCTRWNTQCVMTDWTYTPAPAAVPPAAPSAHSTPPSGITVPAAASHPVTPTPQPTPANPVPPAQSASALTKAYHCVLYVQQGTKSLRYSSGAIRTDVTAPLLNAAWKNEVLATYNINDAHAHGGCQPISAIPARQDNVVNSLEENWKRLGANVIHINWTSAPGQVAPAPSAAPAPTHTATASSASSAPPVNSAMTHLPAQTPQQTAQPVPLAQDPRLAQIPSRIRGMMISEVNAYESTCQGGPAPGAKSACECVARNILNYRIAHASQYSVVYEEHDLVGHVAGWQPYATFLAEAKQGCTQ